MTKKIISLLLVMLLVLMTGCSGTQADDIKRSGRRFLEWPYYDTPEELVEVSTHIFEGIVIDITAEVVDHRTGKAQRTPISAEDPSNYDLVTVYKILVTRNYKGDTNLIEYIMFPGGNWDEMIAEQKKALERAGMYDPEKGILDISPKRDLSFNTTYLFCVKDWEGDYKVPTSHRHFALEYDSAAGNNNPVYNPDKIKELLPYVPHPLLIWGGIPAILLAVYFFLRIKEKRTRKSNAVTDSHEKYIDI